MIDTAKVLAMNENEQYSWVFDNRRKYGYEIEEVFSGRVRFMVLADLAFRLRDEVIKTNKQAWLRACQKMYMAKYNVPICSAHDAEDYVLRQEPIVWILAALIAKEK